MDFPDESLTSTAELHKFREQRAGESIDDFREELADHVKPIDLVESMEIRTGKGWDKMSDMDMALMLLK